VTFSEKDIKVKNNEQSKKNNELQFNIKYRRSSGVNSDNFERDNENISEKPNENLKIIKIKSKSSLKLFQKIVVQQQI
jgi:hypothetical protein